MNSMKLDFTLLHCTLNHTVGEGYVIENLLGVRVHRPRECRNGVTVCCKYGGGKEIRVYL